MNTDLNNDLNFDTSGEVLDLNDFLSEEDIKSNTPPKLEIDDDDAKPKDDDAKPKDEDSKPKDEDSKPKDDDAKPKDEDSKPKDDDVIDIIAEAEQESGKTDYNSLVKSLIERGNWEEFTEIEDEEGNVIPLDEIDIDEDVFYTIYEQQQELTKERLQKDKIDIKGVSSVTQRIIELDKNGGDIKAALNAYENVKSPLESIDLTKEEDQQAVLYMKYRNKDLSEDEIVRIIKGFQSEGELEEKAESAFEELNTAYDKYLDQLDEQAVDRKNKRESALKDYRKNLSSQLDEKFDLNKTFKRKILDLATKPDDKQKFELDAMYNEVRKNPETAAELALFLSDREEFIKQISKKEVTNVKLNSMKKIRLTKRDKKDRVEIGNDIKKEKHLLDLSDI